SVKPLKRFAGMEGNGTNEDEARGRKTGPSQMEQDDYVVPLVLQPPLPLQVFWPLQPASLVLQPPWPLHEFWPLQPCLPLSSARVCNATPACEAVVLAA